MDRRQFLMGATGAVLVTTLPELGFASKRALAADVARPGVGAEIPWKTYLATEMKTNGKVLGPKYGPNRVEMESSRQTCVKLTGADEFVEFTVGEEANAMVVRYSLPDSADGKGVDSGLRVFQNGRLVNTLPITSRYSYVYGNYPFTNDPRDGKPRNFYDEVRAKGLKLAKGDVIRLQKAADGVPHCILDLVDLEQVAPAMSQPADSLSVKDFGAAGDAKADDTEALRKCLTAAAKQGKVAWVPAGDYRLTGDIEMPSHVTLQGAGMWHTNFVGDEALYTKADRRLRFKLTGADSHLADFALVGALKYRNDSEQNDGVFGAHGRDCSISRLWIEHTKVGMWFYVCRNIVIDGCRLRNTLADGVNFCVDVRDSVVQNTTARNTGDDCFAIWPTVSDQSFTQEAPSPGNNVFRRCTAQMPFLANGASIYGGANNRIEDCLFTDIGAGCGILLSTTFLNFDDKLGIDNNFSGLTEVRNCKLVRCGGYDHGFEWRGAMQVCLERRSISGLRIRDVEIRDSLSDGFSVVSPGSSLGKRTLTDVQLENVLVPNSSIGTRGRYALWVRNDAHGEMAVARSKFADVNNASVDFKIVTR